MNNNDNIGTNKNSAIKIFSNNSININNSRYLSSISIIGYNTSNNNNSTINITNYYTYTINNNNRYLTSRS